MMYGYVYKTTNLINGKTYIGQHKSGYFDIGYKGSGKLIKRAIKKYGKDNFKTILLEWCETFDELNNREIYYISFYRAQNKAEYNIANGGLGVRGLFGKNNPFYGKKMTTEHLIKTRRTGSKLSKETKEKISNTLSKQRICHYCGKKIKSGISLKRHIRDSHDTRKEASKRISKKNSEIYYCPYCNKEIKSKGNLTQHIRGKHDSSFKKENICYLK